MEWCTDMGTAELGFKKCAIGQDGTVHLLYGTPSIGVASLYYTYRTSPSVGISTFNYPAINIAVYPNPFSTQTTLQTDNPLHNATLCINKIFGQTAAQIKNIHEQTITIHRNNLPNGLYFIRLTEKTKLLQQVN